MSAAARRSNAQLRASKASSGNWGKSSKSGKKAANKIEHRKNDHGSGKTESSAMKMTQKYGTRHAPRAQVRKTAPAKKSQAAAPTSKSAARSLTNRYGTRHHVKNTKKTAAALQAARERAAARKNEKSEARSLTSRFGSRRG